MKSLTNEKSFWLLLGFILAALFSFLLFNAAGLERVVETTRVIPITRIVKVTKEVLVAIELPHTPAPPPPVQGIRLVPVTVIAQDTRVLNVTRVVPVTLIIPVTRIVDNPERNLVATSAPTEPPVIPAPTEAPPTAILATATSLPTSRPTQIPPPGKLFFSVGDYLYQMELSGGEPNIVASGLRRSEYLVADSLYSKVYVIYWDQPEQIRSFDVYNPGFLSNFSAGPTDGGQGVALDSSNHKLFLGLYYSGVYVMDLTKPGNWTKLVDSGALSPMIGQRGQLQIDPANRHIYFRSAYNGDCGECRYIWRVNYDGSNLVKIIKANGGDALALDLTARKMYFSDVPLDGIIKRANLDGSEVETILTLSAPYDFCRTLVLDLPSQTIYLSLFSRDYNTWRAIARANLDGTDFEILYEFFGNTNTDVLGGIILLTP